MPYIHQEFPKYLFHPTHAPDGKLFRNAAEVAKAGDGWVDSPARFSDSESVSEPSSEDIIPPSVQRAAMEEAINRKHKKEK